MLATATATARPALSALPGSGSPGELFHLLRDPTGFLHERFERHGRLWRTRFVYPAVFAIGDEANRTMLVTRRCAPCPARRRARPSRGRP
jgi:hypothetical protein